MIGLDTNVIVRYIMRDDDLQTRAADALIDSFTPADPGYLSHVALAELWWVLASAYRQDRQHIARLINQLLLTDTLVVPAPDLVHQALRAVTTGADFADALIAATGAADGCGHTMTFDAKAAARAGMTRLA